MRSLKIYRLLPDELDEIDYGIGFTPYTYNICEVYINYLQC